MMIRLGISLGIRYWKEILIGAMAIMFIVFFLFFSWAIPQQEQTINPGCNANLSQSVLQLQPLVQQTATADGIGQYTNVLLGLIQQESGGTIPDVMQSSESLGLPPNSIDTNTSINAGTKYFAGLIQSSKGDVNLALQAYNFGGGFISYALDHGGYSPQVAASFSIQEAHSLGWSSYGDINYVQHVSRYLTTGCTTSQPGKADQVVAIAKNYLTMHTTYVFGAGRNNADAAVGMFDCSSWVWQVYHQSGIDLGPQSSVSTDTLDLQGTAVSDPTQLQPGDLVFWNTYQPNGHVGIYIGNGQAIGCNTNKGVSIFDMKSSYWSTRQSTTMRRIIN